MKDESSEILPKGFFFLPSLRFSKLALSLFFFSLPLCLGLGLVLNAEVVQVEELKPTQCCFISSVM